MTSERKMAIEFVKKYRLNDITTASLRETVKSAGYALVEFSHVSNSPEVESLLTSLKLKQYSQSVDAFTYADDHVRIVFILERLSEEEQFSLLSHELGHIAFNNIITNRVRGDGIIAEKQANEFSHYLLAMSHHGRLLNGYMRRPVLFTSMSIFLLVAFFSFCITVSSFVGFSCGRSSVQSSVISPLHYAEDVPDLSKFVNDAANVSIPDGSPANDAVKRDSVFDDSNVSANADSGLQVSAVVPDNQQAQEPAKTQLTQNGAVQTKSTTQPSQTTVATEAENVSSEKPTVPQNSQQNNQDVYYVTSSGTKYHKAGCSYIKGKENLKTIPASEIASSGYEPCSRCIE